jgi:serine phosphatase RsbU (regulator of sigma subunit)
MATLIKMQEDANTTTDDDDSLLAEMERKAAEVEAQLQQQEEENAELKRRIESYHVEWLRCERDQDQVPGGSLPRTNGCSAGPSVLHLL